jgi:acyl carrier protein phosphodiesterase
MFSNKPILQGLLFKKQRTLPLRKNSMNFLAHAYLSFNNTHLLMGNMLGDFVKGPTQHQFSKPIQQGMLLHRFIDRFTDQHPSFLATKELYRKASPLGAGIFADMVFDHCLAANNAYFTEPQLAEFAQHVYQHLPINHPHTPPVALEFFRAMQQHNWLLHYRSEEGITRAMHNMTRRYPRIGNSEPVLKRFAETRADAQHHFSHFFPELEAACQSEIQRLST